MAAKSRQHGLSRVDPVRTKQAKGLSVFGRMVIVSTVVVMLFVIGSTSAFACAGGFLQAVLFHKYPEAKLTTEAIAEARMQGVLKGEEWSKSSGKSIHAWRSEKTRLTIQALQNRLNSAENPPTALVDTNVFLLKEFAWLRIMADGERITVSRQPYGSPMSEPQVFTSRRVLDNLLASEISWQQAAEQGLIAARCRADCSSDEPYGLLGLAAAIPQEHLQGDEFLLTGSDLCIENAPTGDAPGHVTDMNVAAVGEWSLQPRRQTSHRVFQDANRGWRDQDCTDGEQGQPEQRDLAARDSFQ